MPALLDADQEANIVAGSMELQRTVCNATSDCFTNADCISGVCTCTSPLVESGGQVCITHSQAALAIKQSCKCG